VCADRVVVGKIKVILGLAVLALIASTGWQIAACELANYELKDDLKDLASMGGARIGLDGPGSDEELCFAVIRRAAEHDIRLRPEQIRIERSGTVDSPVVFLSTRYQSRVVMPGISLIFHFTATSR